MKKIYLSIYLSRNIEIKIVSENDEDYYEENLYKGNTYNLSIQPSL